MKKSLGGMALAFGFTGSLLLGSGPAQAAAGPDLDVTQCTIVDDPVDYGDGIDWYKLLVTYKNEGTAPTGNQTFQNRVRPVYGIDEFSGQLGNEANVRFSQAPMAAGQSVSTFYWLTKKVVDQHTWGIFLDVNHQVTGETQTNDNFCSFFADNS
ncbi:hypothetical protein JOF56_010892 [Kibdelosporangium banguiense]|uniref:CARDB protein n=1 Tax=Kibdelosporangium banguiense TaxID=1365924 RepID=A0ABS4U1H7_9PSEU|nr:hypothetical protein [Kibdelosporangium banguiense]MBP2330507.1 hypothetical protein [Kibdelosporangium banguiense]